MISVFIFNYKILLGGKLNIRRGLEKSEFVKRPITKNIGAVICAVNDMYLTSNYPRARQMKG